MEFKTEHILPLLSGELGYVGMSRTMTLRVPFYSFSSIEALHKMYPDQTRSKIALLLIDTALNELKEKFTDEQRKQFEQFKSDCLTEELKKDKYSHLQLHQQLTTEDKKADD